MRIVIITPTYNEAENITNFIRRVFDAVQSCPQHECHLFIIDANSPDSTADIVKKMQGDFKRLHLLVEEKKKGLGGAYIQAIPYVLDKYSPDVIMEMDADLSHKPEDIKRFLAEIDNGYDFVIGSRQIPGGSIPKDWGLYRKVLSVVGNLISRLMTGIWDVHDHTAGFRAIRVKGVLDKVDVSAFSRDKYISRSYAFQIKLLYEAIKMGAKVKEIPVEFVDRTKGKSKMSFSNILDTLILLSFIRFQESKKFIQVTIVGGVGFLVQTIVLLILVERLFFDKVLATIVSAELAIVSNFILNNSWTFKDRVRRATVPVRFLQFNLTSVGSILIQAGVMWIGLRLFGETMYLFYFGVGVLIGLIWNYLFYSRVIWKN